MPAAGLAEIDGIRCRRSLMTSASMASSETRPQKFSSYTMSSCRITYTVLNLFFFTIHPSPTSVVVKFLGAVVIGVPVEPMGCSSLTIRPRASLYPIALCMYCECLSGASSACLHHLLALLKSLFGGLSRLLSVPLRLVLQHSALCLCDYQHVVPCRQDGIGSRGFSVDRLQNLMIACHLCKPSK